MDNWEDHPLTSLGLTFQWETILSSLTSYIVLPARHICFSGEAGAQSSDQTRGFFNLENFLFFVIYLSNKPNEGTGANEVTTEARSDQSGGEKLRCDIGTTLQTSLWSLSTEKIDQIYLHLFTSEAILESPASPPES